MVKEVTARDVKRDVSCFTLKYDPITSPSLEHSRYFQKDMGQEIERLQRVWGGPAWREDETFDRNMQNQLPPFRRFCKVSAYEPIRAFVLELQNQARGITEEAAFTVVNKVLTFINAHYQVDEGWVIPLSFHSPCHLRLADRVFQLYVFAPCWSMVDSQQREGWESIYLVFVAEANI